MATADQLERQVQQAAQRAQADYLARVQAGSAAGTRISPDTALAGARAAGAVASGQSISTTYRPGEFIGGADRRTANGGAVVDGYYIPPGINFSTSTPTSQPSGGGTPSGNTSSSTTTPDLSGIVADIAFGGGGGGGAAIAAPTSNVDQTSALYAQALEELQRQYGVSQENILAAIGRMRSDPYNQANAYAGMQLADPRVAANPVAEYMAAAGMAPGQAAAQQQMAQAEADAYLRAMQNVQGIMSTSQQQANASRMADIGLIETGATQDLESNLNMLRLGLERERIGSLTGLQQRNLENDMQMRNAITNQISSIFAGQNVSPESILKLIQAALAKINTNQWTQLPGMGG